MAIKSRRRTRFSESRYKVVTLACSFACIVLNLSIAYLCFAHPYKEIFDNVVLLWSTYVNLAFVLILIYLTWIIYQNQEASMKWVFIALCTLFILEIFVSFAVIIAYVIIIDQKLSELKVDVQSALIREIEDEFECQFVESKNSTKKRKCIPVLRIYVRNMAVYKATIYITTLIFLGSEALMILFHYMNYLPT